MSVVVHQVLQPDMGAGLAPAVRDALVDAGNACNSAAVHLHQALTNSMQMEALVESNRSRGGATAAAERVSHDLLCLADQHFEQAIVVLARAATTYAVYASRVADAVARRAEPPPPGAVDVRPSDIIRAYRLYLPEVHFLTSDRREALEQNSTVAEARRHLIGVITQHLDGEDAESYDDVAVAALPPGQSHRSAEFPAVMHAYAGALVWALAVVGGIGCD